MSLQRFEGKVAIVTGAGSGIGAITAMRFWDEGAAVVVTGRTKEKLTNVVKWLDNERSLIHVSDVTKPGDGERLVADTLKRFGRIDVLVNNAGVNTPGGFLDKSPEEWDRIVGTNLNGVFNLTRAALPSLLETKGTIVNISSGAGHAGSAGNSFYAAAKAAVNSLTRSLALEFGPQGVRVNAVSPGVIATEMTAPLFESDVAFTSRLLERVPLGRLGRSEDIAAAVTFLASADAGYINGVVLAVDGGVTASSGLAPWRGPKSGV